MRRTTPSRTTTRRTSRSCASARPARGRARAPRRESSRGRPGQSPRPPSPPARRRTRKAKRLAFAHSSQFITREAAGLAERVAALAPGDMKKTGRVYLVSGGSEAIETALKLARQYHIETGQPGKSKIIA